MTGLKIDYGHVGKPVGKQIDHGLQPRCRLGTADKQSRNRKSLEALNSAAAVRGRKTLAAGGPEIPLRQLRKSTPWANWRVSGNSSTTASSLKLS